MQPNLQHKIITPNYKINGLTYVKQLITKQQQSQLIKDIIKEQWNTSLKRRTQHYGYQYIYDRTNQLNQALPLPEWSTVVKKRIQQLINQSSTPQQQQVNFNQLIINEYQPGQGINPHIDNPTLFSTPIVSLSLGSQCIMEFDHPKHQDCIQLTLNRRSIFLIDQEARYQWKHSIPARKKDNGKLRSVRYSLTFRTVKKDALKVLTQRKSSE